jgi:hypothetical protein
MSELHLFDPPCPVCHGTKKVFSRRRGEDTSCTACGGSGIEAYDAHAPVRHRDPEESREAAEKVHVAKDRMLVLRGFARLEYPATYHEAALSAAKLEGTSGDHFREESLRRRGSDLKVLGLIAQIGRRDGKATFLITEKGRKQT